MSRALEWRAIFQWDCSCENEGRLFCALINFELTNSGPNAGLIRGRVPRQCQKRRDHISALGPRNST